MKLWIDDVRPAPEGYVWCKSVNEAKKTIQNEEHELNERYKKLEFDKSYGLPLYVIKAHYNCIKELAIAVIDIDHDAGDYASDGGDYIKLLDWLEETGRNYPIHIHSMNPVGAENMRRIIQRNGWTEVKE